MVGSMISMLVLGGGLVGASYCRWQWRRELMTQQEALSGCDDGSDEQATDDKQLSKGSRLSDIVATPSEVLQLASLHSTSDQPADKPYSEARSGVATTAEVHMMQFRCAEVC